MRDLKPLFPGQPITQDGQPASLELLEILQSLSEIVRDLQRRVNTLEELQK